jgi:hypothetical protein
MKQFRTWYQELAARVRAFESRTLGDAEVLRLRNKAKARRRKLAGKRVRGSGAKVRPKGWKPTAPAAPPPSMGEKKRALMAICRNAGWRGRSYRKAKRFERRYERIINEARALSGAVR